MSRRSGLSGSHQSSRYRVQRPCARHRIPSERGVHMSTWSDNLEDYIQPGDIFIKMWGSRLIVHMMLPRVLTSAKQPYINLTTGTAEATWCMYRSTYHGA